MTVLVKKSAPVLSDEHVSEVLGLIEGADGVELKLTVPDADRRSAVAALEMDVLDSQIRRSNATSIPLTLRRGSCSTSSRCSDRST